MTTPEPTPEAVKYWIDCPDCGGTGTDKDGPDAVSCPGCGGIGEVLEEGKS